MQRISIVHRLFVSVRLYSLCCSFVSLHFLFDQELTCARARASDTRHGTRRETRRQILIKQRADHRSSRTLVYRRDDTARREIRRQHGKGDSRIRYNHPYMGLNYIQICKYFWRNGDKRCHSPSTSLDSSRIERFVFTHIFFTTLSFLLHFNVLPTCSTFLHCRFLRFHRFAILRITYLNERKKNFLLDAFHIDSFYS